MKLDQLRMLKTVAETGSLSNASERLFKTQSAISQGIKQLETSLAIQLFDRKAYRLSLTPAGEQVYSHALRMLNDESEIRQIAKYLANGNESIVKIAIEASYDLNRITPILEKVQNEFPRTQIILKVEYLSGAFEAVESEQVDMAITPMQDLDLEVSNIEAGLLYTGNLINVAAPRLLLRHPELQSVVELCNEYQIVVQDSGISSKGKNYSVQSGQRCWYANDFSTKKSLVMSGMGWGRLPDNRIVDELQNGSLIEIQLNDLRSKLGLNFHVIKARNSSLGPVANTLWNNLMVSG
jgi:DNA-binding transcriptional LysR family regulator